uniref:RING-type domain-containing protein n=1 Tax=Parastrongyloides trichosuri TaxID=131310 RepID=A0A0N4Z6G4_PARTI
MLKNEGLYDDFIVGVTTMNPANINLNNLPPSSSDQLENDAYMNIFPVTNDFFGVDVEEYSFSITKRGVFWVECCNDRRTKHIGKVSITEKLWIFFKISDSFKKIYCSNGAADSDGNVNIDSQLQRRLVDGYPKRLFPGYYDDTNNDAVYNGSSGEVLKDRLYKFLYNIGLPTSHYISTGEVEVEAEVFNTDKEIINPTIPETAIKSDYDRLFEETDKKLCVVCITERKSILCYPCGHFCFCEECAEKHREHSITCPVCRKYIEDYVKVYE